MPNTVTTESTYGCHSSTSLWQKRQHKSSLAGKARCALAYVRKVAQVQELLVEAADALLVGRVPREVSQRPQQVLPHLQGQAGGQKKHGARDSKGRAGPKRRAGEGASGGGGRVGNARTKGLWERNSEETISYADQFHA